MGEVYRATDTRLDREVAIKVLPDDLAGEPERLARFEREARTLANVNHPNVAVLYGLERQEATGAMYLAMELVEGCDLAQDIARGPMPVGKTVEIAVQIARGLDAAHANGIKFAKGARYGGYDVTTDLSSPTLLAWQNITKSQPPYLAPLWHLYTQL